MHIKCYLDFLHKKIFVIRKLHLLVLRSYLGPFTMAFSIVLFLLVMQFMALYMAEIAGKGLDAKTLLQLFYYAAARLVVMAMPVSLLAAALITLGGMGEHYEIAAIKSCGISLFRLSTPLIAFAILLTAISLYFSFYTIPRANLKFFSLLYDVQRKKAEVAIVPGYFYADIDNYIIRISDKNKKTGMMYDFLLYNHSENRGNVDVIYADSAKMMMEPGYVQLRLVLYHGSRYEEMRPEQGKGANNQPFGRTYFDSLYYRISISGFEIERTDESLFAKHQVTMIKDSLEEAIVRFERKIGREKQQFETNLRSYNGLDSTVLNPIGTNVQQDSQYIHISLGQNESFLAKIKHINTVDALNRAISNTRSLRSNLAFRATEMEDSRKQYHGYLYELYGMYAIPFNCLVFMLIGISFGAIIRKGGLGLPSLISILFFVIFYILLMQGKKLSKDGVISPMIGACLPIIILTPVAIAALYQASTDASVFDESVRDSIRDKIGMFFQRLFSRKK